MAEGAKTSPSGGMHAAFRAPYSGLILTVVGIALILITRELSGSLMSMTSPVSLHLTYPFINLVGRLVALFGIAIAVAGLAHVRAPRDYWGGVAMLAIVIVAFWGAEDLASMRGFAFGPGTAPRLFAVLLGLAALGIIATGLLSDGPPIEAFAVRGPALVVISILLFANVIRPLGLIVATFLTFLLSITASSEMRWLESVIAAAAMTAFCVGLFVYLLQLPFQLLPTFMY